MLPVPQTDTGRWDEYSKARGRTLVKELCKLAPYLRYKVCLLWYRNILLKAKEVATKSPSRLFTKNTALC